MKRLIITEEEKSRILGMHQNAIRKEYLMEDNADISPQVEAAYNQILTTLRPLLKTYLGVDRPVTFGNPIRESKTSGAEGQRIFYNVTITVGGTRPETFTARLGTYIDSTNYPKMLSNWQFNLIQDFANGITNVQTNSKTWTTLKIAILDKLKTVKLATPTQPK